MKVNSENLWGYINNLGTNEKVKFNVYYDDVYVTQIYWNGDNFEWEQGKFTSEAFFNPLYDFVVIEEGKKIPEKIEEEEIEVSMAIGEQICANKINEIIDYLNSIGDE